MARRKPISPKIQTAVMTLSRRRCCLCFFLDGKDETGRGQIAHLNRDASDSRFDNLVWLCLNHHDQYDSTTRLSKGLTEPEVRVWRLKLVQHFDGPDATWSLNDDGPPKPQSRRKPARNEQKEGSLRAWRFPLWLEEDRMDLFAYTAGHGSDGVCLIERIDLPDGRTVVACLQAPGNPGTSITNAVEAIAGQVCDRFDIDPRSLVWLEHYPFMQPQEWSRVDFGRRPPAGAFAEPTWTTLSAVDWRAFGLRPIKALRMDGLTVHSKLRKLFDRPEVEDGDA